MVPRQSTRDRGNRDRATRKRRREKRPLQKTRHHPLFGEIPLVTVQWTDGSGSTHELLDYDPDYRPPLPQGAVRGDVRRQEFCRMCHMPRYFYVDEKKTCVQCGQPFVFGAAEQKYWYETLHFHFDSIAVRCPDCRRKRRTELALREQIARARAGLAENARDPSLLLTLAEAIVRYHQRRDQGNLDDAIAAARKASRVSRGMNHRGAAVEAVFWEASCHALAGRPRRAKELYGEFLLDVPSGGRYRTLAREAEEWLAQAISRGEH